MDSEGIPFGAIKALDLNNSTTVEGIAYFDGGFAVVQGPMVETH